MKYINVILLILALWASWEWIYHSEGISEDTHATIQADLKKIIAEYVQKNSPDSTQLRFEKMWTEALNKNRIKASFVYSFIDTDQLTNADSNEESTRTKITGSAILNRDLKAPKNEDIWSFDKLKIDSNHLEFEEGITIKANDSEDEQ